MATRGCPHNCSYCCNNVLRKIYATEVFIRKRPIKHIIDEIVLFKDMFDFTGIITLTDDTFFTFGTEEIKQFAEEYKFRVNLPLRCLVSPLTLNEEKLKYLVNAGLIHIGMGIQTGCERTKKLYNREIPNDLIIKAASIINKYTDYLLPPTYDVLIENPYETKDENLETLRFLSTIPRPFEILPFKLIFFPGTEMYEKAKKDGIIKDEITEIYNCSFSDIPCNFVNLLYFSVHLMPRIILKILLRKNIAVFFNKKVFNSFWFVTYVYLRMPIINKINLTKHITKKILNKLCVVRKVSS